MPSSPQFEVSLRNCNDSFPHQSSKSLSQRCFPVGLQTEKWGGRKKGNRREDGVKERPLCMTDRHPPSNALNTCCQNHQLQRVGTYAKRGPRNPKYSISAFSVGATWGPATSMEGGTPPSGSSEMPTERTAFWRESCRADCTCHQPALLPHGILCLSRTCFGHSLY